MQPLDTGLNVAIMHIAAKLFPTGFDVSADAPATFDELKAHLDAGKRMVVFSGGSDTTIYADQEVNWCFRAWHDWCHWRGNHPISFAGECAACVMQARHLVTLYGNGPTVRRWTRIIHAEIIGQNAFSQDTATFRPIDTSAPSNTWESSDHRQQLHHTIGCCARPDNVPLWHIPSTSEAA